MKTELNDYTLYFDGTIGCNEDQLCFFLMERRDLLDKIFVDNITPDVISFNDHNNSGIKLTLHDDAPFNFDLSWQIEEMNDDDIADSIIDKLEQYISKRNITSESTIDALYKRTLLELQLFKKINKFDYLKTLIYIIKQLTAKDVVWNGRGSAASSFVLFLIGVHRVDSFKYQLPVEEFFKISN